MIKLTIKPTWLLAISICLSMPMLSSAKEGSYKECYKIAKSIEALNTKRKRGGSGKQMDKWRKKRHQLSNKAYTLKCRKHGIMH